MQEDLTFALKLNASQLNAGMASARAGAANLGGDLGKVTGALDKIGGKSGADARQAIGSLSFVMGGASKQGAEMVNVIGDIAGALAGGGLTIGLVAAFAAGGAAMDAYNEAQARTKEATDNFKKSLIEIEQAIVNRTNVALEKSAKRLSDIREELRLLGVDSDDAKVIAAKDEAEAAERRLASATNTNADAQEKLAAAREKAAAAEARFQAARGRAKNEGQISVARNALKAELAALNLDSLEAGANVAALTVSEAKRQTDKLRAEFDQTFDEVEKLKARKDQIKQDEENERKAEEARKKAQREREEIDGLHTSSNSAESNRGRMFAKIIAERRKEEAEDLKALKELEDKRAEVGQAAFDKRAARLAEEAKKREDIEKEHQEALTKIADDEADKRKRKREQEEQDRLALASQVTQQVVGIAVSGSQQYLDAWITGQDHALEHTLAGISRQAGSALIGHGINLAGAATVSALTGALPAAGIQAAGAAGLIGAGIALGGVATGIEHTLAGGAIGQKLPENPSGNRSRGGRGGTGDEANGTFQIVVNYGVAGPAPEDTARAVAKANRTAARRGIG